MIENPGEDSTMPSASARVVERLAVAAWVATVENFHFVEVNHGAEKLLGYPASAWLGDPQFFIRHVHPRDRPEVEQNLRALGSGASKEITHRFYTADQRVLWIRCIVSRLDGLILAMMIDSTPRKLEEARRDRAETNLRAVLANATMALIVADEDLRISWIEGATERFQLAGVSTGSRLEDVFVRSPWIVERARAGFDEGASLGSGPLGALGVEVHCSRLHGNDEDVAERVAVILVDATERMAAERELRFQKRLLEQQNEAAPDGILVVSPKRGVISANRRFREIWGLQKGLVEHGDDEELIMLASRHVKDPDAFLSRVQWLYENPRAESREEIALRDGRVLERYTAPVVDAELDVCYGRLWSFRDITERRELVEARSARRAAEDSEHRAALLAEAAGLIAGPLGDVEIAALGRALLPYLGNLALFYLQEGPAFFRVISAIPAGATRVSVFASLVPDLRAPGGIASALRSGAPVVTSLPENGEWPDASATPLPLDEPGRTVRELMLSSYLAIPIIAGAEALGAAVFAARSERIYDSVRTDLATAVLARLANALVADRLHRATRAAVSARDEFLSIASHELRTPVAGLRLAIEAILRLITTGRVAPLDPPVAGLLVNAREHLLHLGTLVDRLLDVTRISSGQLQLELEQVDLVALVKLVVDRLRMERSREDSQIEVTGDGSVVGFWDRVRLEQVVTNLVGNAIKYGAGQPISVKVTRENNAARLDVIDHGIGIPPDKLGRIFERFERGAHARGYPGLGLGLYIVRQIVDRLGGRVFVESRLGLGSTFTVLLGIESPRDGKTKRPGER